MKSELINNEIANITIEQYQTEYSKAMEFLNTESILQLTTRLSVQYTHSKCCIWYVQSTAGLW